MSSGPTSVGGLPGCPNLAHGPNYLRGYCSDHSAMGVVEALDDVCGFLDRLNRIYEDRRNS